MAAKHSLEGKQVMVTGGCGFIGSFLLEQLLERGVERVIVLDSLRYGSRRNIENLDTAKVELRVHELGPECAAEGLEKGLRGVDYLFHCAAEKHNQARDEPTRVLRSNIEGTHNLLAAACRQGVKKVVFASSLYAYGRMKGGPYLEEELPRPTTVYGLSKLAGEHLGWHFADACGLEVVALRYLFVYGPRQHAGLGYKSVIVRTFERILRGEPAVIHGDGRQQLDYVYVSDAVEATVQAMESPLNREVLNVGTGRGTSIEALVDAMIAVTGRPVAKRNAPEDWTAGSVRVGCPDKITQLLGWRPRVGLGEGLARTWAWMSERQGETVASPEVC